MQAPDVQASLVVGSLEGSSASNDNENSGGRGPQQPLFAHGPAASNSSSVWYAWNRAHFGGWMGG